MGQIRVRGEQMGEPAIVDFGRWFIGDYTAEEYLDALRRIFKSKDVMVINDSNTTGVGKLLASAAAWGIDNGLLCNHNNEDDGKQVVSYFRLTNEGIHKILGQP